MSILYRRAELDDLPEVMAVNRASFNALNQRHGYVEQQMDEQTPLNPFFAFSLKEEPEGFWVAEDHGKIVGLSISWIRDWFWFLSYLFIAPDYQGKRVGRTLMERALEHGVQRSITTRGLITFAFNPVSISLYMRYGMYPRDPLYWMEGPSANIPATQTNEGILQWENLDPNRKNVKDLCRIDESVLGFGLEKHHLYLLPLKGSTCYLFRKNDRPEGYAYVRSDGHLGPVATLSQDSFKSILNAALGLAAQKAGRVSFLIDGSNEYAVTIARERKLRIVRPLLLMSTKPFGNWSQYLFHSPGLM